MSLLRIAVATTACCSIAALGIAGCGSGGEEVAKEVGTLNLKLEQPSSPLAKEGVSTGIRLLRGDEVAYAGDFWRLPKGRENETTGTTRYDLDTAELPPGDYRVRATIRACGPAGCSAEDLGVPSLRCSAHVQVKADEPTILTVVVRGLDAGECGFAVSGG